MKKIWTTLVGIGVLVGASACGTPYNIDHPLPDDSAEAGSVFPDEIDGESGNGFCQELDDNVGETCSVTYGKLGTIFAGKFESTQAGTDFFYSHTNSLDTTSMESSGTDGEQWMEYTLENGVVGFAWHKKRWVFDIASKSEANLHTLMDGFDYISRE